MQTTKSTNEYWSELYDNGRDFSLISFDVITKLLSFAANGAVKTCLDIGCGTGQLTRELFHRGYSCIGIDAAGSAISIAQSLTTVPVEQLKYTQFDIETQSLADLPKQQFSLVTCKLVYAFIQDKALFINHVKHLLAPGGIFVVITPHINDVSEERRGIAVTDGDMELLSASFQEIAQYKGNERGGALTYFIGK